MSVLTIMGLSLRRVTRDRQALFFMILLPVLITLIIGVSIFKSVDTLSVGLVTRDSAGALSKELASQIRSTKGFQVEELDSVEAARKAIRRSNILAAVIIPKDYDAALRRGDRVSVEILVDPVRNAPIAARERVGAIIASQAELVQAARFASTTRGGSFDDNLARAKRLSADTGNRVGVDVGVVGSAREAIPTGFGYTAPANLVLVVFINSLVAGAILIDNRRMGLTKRMLSTPLTSGRVLLGEALGRFAISLVQGAIILVIGALLFGVDYGNLLGAILIVIMISLVATAIAMLVGTIFRTPEQAGSVGPIIGIGMGMLSGCMWPLEIVSAPMRAAGHIFPQAWAMDGFIKLIARGASVADILPELGMLSAFALVLLPLGAWRLRRVTVG